MFTEQEKQIILKGQELGKSPTEVKQALAKYREQTGYMPPPPPQPVQKSTVGSRVSGVIDRAGSNVADAIAGDGAYEGQSGLARGFQAAGSAATAVPGAAIAALPEPVTSVLGTVAKPFVAGFKKIVDSISDTKLFSEIGELEAQGFINKDTAPELYRTIEGLKIAKGGGEVASTVLLADQTAKLAQAGVDKTVSGVKAGAEKVNTLGHTGVDKLKSLRKDAQVSLGEKSVDPQLQASAERLAQTPRFQASSNRTSQKPRYMEGVADRIDDPVATYDDYFKKAQASTKDIKLDTPLEGVGSKIGDSFKKVVQKRRDVGATMGEELKNVGHLKTTIDDTFTTLETNLDDAGLAVDGLRGKLVPTGASKLAKEDVALLEKYIKDLNSLGGNPTVAQLDAHLSRTQSMVDYAKSAQGMVNTTPGERLIKIAQGSLRESLKPEVSNIPELAKYAQARAEYAKLSDFIDEGSGYLGKVTQTGDFAKDASIAKSAVQSLLNSGKKDWMMKLEELTGYNAMDDSVLALQAMKDAGIAKGESLLQLMSDGANVPTSATGIGQQALQYALKAGKRAIGGTPDQQTRAFLQSLKDAAKSVKQGGAVSKATTPKSKPVPESSSKTITERLRSNKQGGYISNPLVRDEIKSQKPSAPQGRNLYSEAKEALKKFPKGNPAALELIRMYLKGKGSAITRTELATAIDMLNRAAK